MSQGTAPILSCVVNTGRPDYPMPDHPDVHLFDHLTAQLRAQEGAPPFELVVADTEYASRATWFRDNPQPFPVKHVPVRSWWLDKGCCAISASKNASVIHADGAQIVTVDDCTALPPRFLALAHEWMNRGIFPIAWYNVPSDPGYRDPRLDAIPAGEEFAVSRMDDTAWAAHLWPIHGWGYVGFTAAAFYAVNGYEEWYDGGRGQEDIEFSLRLMRAGYPLVVDRDFYVDLQRQGPDAIASRAERAAERPAESTYTVHCTSALSPLLYAEIARGERLRANAEPWPDRLRDALHPVCQWYIPDRRHDTDAWACSGCEAVLVTPAGAHESGALYCGKCDNPLPLYRDPDRSRDWRGCCSLYGDHADDRHPCPYAPRKPGEDPPAYPTRHGHHPIYIEGRHNIPERTVRDLYAEHREIVEGRRREGTYVGVDWRR